MDKKYYWLKLKKDFFKRHDIKIIEDMDNGKDYILFYLKLLCESVDHEGNLRFSDTIPYNEKMLATITNTNVDIVRSALKVFTELNMLEILEDKTIFMTECNRMLGSETYWAEQKRKQRIGQCPTNVQLMSNVSKQEIDIDKEKDKEINIDVDRVVIIKKLFSNFILDEALNPEIDANVLAQKVDESDYLKGFEETKASWINKHYLEIVAGKYRTFVVNKNQPDFETRKYSKEEMNSVFDNIDDIDL